MGASVLSTLPECPSHNPFVPCHHLPSGYPLCRYPAACQVATCPLVSAEISVNIMYTGWQRILKDERSSSLCLVSVTIHTPAHVRPWIRRAHWASLIETAQHGAPSVQSDQRWRERRGSRERGRRRERPCRERRPWGGGESRQDGVAGINRRLVSLGPSSIFLREGGCLSGSLPAVDLGGRVTVGLSLRLGAVSWGPSLGPCTLDFPELQKVTTGRQ